MDSDPTKSPLNVEKRWFKEWQCQRSVRCECSARKKAAANTNSNQSPLSQASRESLKILLKTLKKGLFLCLNT